MSELIYRTEELTPSQISEYFVSSEYEQEIIDKLKAPSPVLLIGSRGVGKSFLFKVSELQMLQEYEHEKVLPVSLTFRKASLIKTSTPEQFQYWMLARICSELLRALRRQGKIPPVHGGLNLLAGEKEQDSSRIDTIICEFEESWKTPGKEIEITDIPTLDDFLDAVQDLCEELDITRIVLFIDEAAHLFLPQQQREFFTLFRDLRSPYIKCNAAVYPGVTVYGDTFEPTHDAVKINLVRSISDANYVSNMKEMVLRQVKDSALAQKLARNDGNFTLLAFAASGNPRYLLNSVTMAAKMDSGAINQVFREYYREKQWAEHTKLADRYPGYKGFIDWGRDFLETVVLPELKRKNDDYLSKTTGKGTTLYFWVHNGVPHEVKESLRILEYSGLVYEDASGIRATRKEVGTRYMVNVGCLLALEATPSLHGREIVERADIRRMSEYGANQEIYGKIQGYVAQNDRDSLQEQLAKSIDLLDLTDWQKQKLREISINSIGELIGVPEEQLKRVRYIADVRARNIKNAGIAAVCEYLLG